MQLATTDNPTNPGKSGVPDFSRNVHCLFGLPFDAVGSDEAVDNILDAVSERRRCVLSTPNLNFMVASQDDAAFRHSVIHSDLSVVDGMPLVWAGRCLGVPFRGRVAGSGLFESLHRRNTGQTPVKVYLFGGDQGVADKACAAINASGGGVECVGHASPGFGSMESMSTPEILAAINSSGADFLVVSLGAKKGQAWIEHNITRLDPPVVSYLGAVINFMAGTVRRAPPWMQRNGLEWLWRISEERGLWKRYWDDGRQALGLIGKNVAPGLLTYYLDRHRFGTDQASLDIVETELGIRLSLVGAWTAASLEPLRQALSLHADTNKQLHIDLGDVTFIDSSFVALMVMLRRFRLDSKRVWYLENVSVRLKRLLRMYGAADITDRHV